MTSRSFGHTPGGASDRVRRAYARSSGTIEDPSLEIVLDSLGFPQVRELDELEALAIPGGCITGVPFQE